jgi:hypothetical protein
MILLFHEPSEEPGYTLERSDEPPAFVRLKKGGILTLYYDNYVVITGDSAEAEFWNHRILRNCEKVAGDRGELCRLLSIEFGIMATSRGRKLVQTDRKVTGGPHRVYPFPEVISPQRIAQITGTLIYAALMRLEPLGKRLETRKSP